MNFPSLLRTSVMRVTLRYVALVMGVVTVGFSVLIGVMDVYVEGQMTSSLLADMARLQATDRRQGRGELIARLQPGNVATGRFYLLQGADGQRQAGHLTEWPEAAVGDGVVRTVTLHNFPGLVEPEDADDWHVVATDLSDGARLLVAQNAGDTEDLMQFLFMTMVVIDVVAIGLAMTLGWFLARTLLVRIDTINRAAGRVREGNLTERIPSGPYDDEFDLLSGHLNAMLDRIALLMTRMKQVSEDVAHDLRRPLSRIRNRIEVTLLQRRSAGEYEHVLAETTEDIDHLMKTFNALLEIARIESSQQNASWTTVDLAPVLTGLAELYQGEAEAQHRPFHVHIEPHLMLHGHGQLVAQAVTNLLDNAFKYSGAGDTVSLTACRDQHQVRIVVADCGPGIAATERGRVLERFVRLGNDRSTSGSGLGLSLVSAVAKLHGAGLELSDNGPGLTVTLSLVAVDGIDEGGPGGKTI
jgi:signal transduction histidine kinase